ncbi:hypothetical protein F2Q68_00026356 [Brassica cretica]|uniref:Uncharacterized protein n=1 Tax=Brassica cretica TaxID=69181 RepID=A0A8S9I7K0_BRACR|nr:hypothetical protein F2Q68_00026356 [Brassica cretica]
MCADDTSIEKGGLPFLMAIWGRPVRDLLPHFPPDIAAIWDILWNGSVDCDFFSTKGRRGYIFL